MDVAVQVASGTSTGTASDTRRRTVGQYSKDEIYLI